MFKDAYRIFNESLDINKELGNTYSVVYANLELARIHNHLGRYQEALALAQEAKKDAERENYVSWIASSHVDQGVSLLGEGDYKKGREHLQESIEILRSHGSFGYLTSVIPNLSICMHGLGDYVAMRDVILEALQVNARISRQLGYLNIFPALALMRLVDGDLERAIEYYAYAASHRYVADSQWYYDVAGRHIELAAESLSPEVASAAQERGRNLDPGEVTKEVLIELEARDESVNNG